jgi:hypothetical protein
MKRSSDVVLSADMFFEDESGEYNWVEDKLRHAHEWCFEKTGSAMMSDTPRIFVANVFDRDSDVETYRCLAKKHGYEFMSIIMENRNHNHSVHNVTIESISRMKSSFSVKLD